MIYKPKTGPEQDLLKQDFKILTKWPISTTFFGGSPQLLLAMMMKRFENFEMKWKSHSKVRRAQKPFGFEGATADFACWLNN